MIFIFILQLKIFFSIVNSFVRKKVYLLYLLTLLTNYNFNCNNQIIINKNLKKTNVCSRKLKDSRLIYIKDRVVHIKKNEYTKALKVYHINSLHEQFPELVFFDDDDDHDLFVDTSPNVSGQSSY